MLAVRATHGLLASGNGRLLWIEGGVLSDITGPESTRHGCRRWPRSSELASIP
jgi:hypothetical protein